MLSESALAAEDDWTGSVSCQEYPWRTFAERAGTEGAYKKTSVRQLNRVAEAGFDTYEPSFSTAEEVDRLADALAKVPLRIPSFYVNSVLHDPDEADASIAEAVRIGRRAVGLGAKIAVSNPNPIRWGGDEAKSDEQVRFQAVKLNELGAAFREIGLTLAYHNHDAEMRQSAKEFHHMMLGTDPKNVSLCLDAHWIYRGSGDSNVVLADIIGLYADRVVELHLRQSVDGIWTEAFGPGDLDYDRIAKAFSDRDRSPLVVLEQAVEPGSPETLDAVEAHRRSLAAASKQFAGLLGSA